ncbi:zinc finger protein 184 [Eurytemora carolleeae]|uniref:zinc finger protein 184 n=1 Tax=Eurytemora carolleeae TaxID=1294199 RepID=UPI000C7675E6|nr:zinc finger protein 184 [Eurytemora carolleeae]|eukprot:XP_023322946.1 zinc finger protein 184-like [Eurytemora affinis]
MVSGEDGIFAIADYQLLQDETYEEFFSRMVLHQQTHLVRTKNDILTQSHLNLLVVLWLGRVHPGLPALAGAHFKEKLETGSSLENLVPEICLRIENMLKKIEEAAEVSERTERVLNLFEADWEVINKDSIEEREVAENMKKELTLSLPGLPDCSDEIKLELGEEVYIEDVTEDKAEENIEDVNEDKTEHDIKGFQDDAPKAIVKTKAGKKPQRSHKTKLININKEANEGKKRKPIKESIRGKRKNENLFSCEQCEYTTYGPRQFKLHRVSEHGAKDYHCAKCDLLLPTQELFSEHRNSHRREDKEMHCEACGFVANKRVTLNRHLFMKHNKGDGYQCDQCEFRTLQSYVLKNHIISSHLKLKRFICAECGSRFIRNGELTDHVKARHRGEKYLCDQCDFQTSYRRVFGQHRKQMHGDKAFFCDKCDFKAACKLHLRNHKITIHGNITFYPCDQCEYNARRPSLLKEHKESKHMGILFSCTLCEQRMSRKWHMKRHMLLKHKIENWNI